MSDEKLEAPKTEERKAPEPKLIGFVIEDFKEGEIIAYNFSDMREANSKNGELKDCDACSTDSFRSVCGATGYATIYGHDNVAFDIILPNGKEIVGIKQKHLHHFLKISASVHLLSNGLILSSKADLRMMRNFLYSALDGVNENITAQIARNVVMDTLDSMANMQNILVPNGTGGFKPRLIKGGKE